MITTNNETIKEYREGLSIIIKLKEPSQEEKNYQNKTKIFTKEATIKEKEEETEIIIPEEKKLKEPITIILEQEFKAKNKIKITAGKKSKAIINYEVLEKNNEKGTGLIINELTINIGEEAEIIMNEMNSNSKNTQTINKKEINIKQKGKAELFNHQEGEGIIIEERTITLKKEAEIKTRTTGIIKEGENYIKTIIKHEEEESKSDLKTRIINEKGKALIKALTIIEEEAGKSEAQQKIDLLNLKEEAISDALPELEIKNNEVKCNHGATIGGINEEEKYYLRSRGINEEEAKRLISKAFLQTINKNKETIKKEERETE